MRKLISPLPRRLRAFSVRALRRDARGAVMVEMAFAIPFLVLLGFGGLEIANLTLAHTRISQIGLTVADNAARVAVGSNMALPRIRELDINEIFAGIDKQASGLDFKQNGRLILSSLETNQDGGQWIHWQRCFGDLKVDPSFGKEGDGKRGKSFPGMGPAGSEVKAPEGSAVMFVEVVYQYQPIAYGSWLGPKTIRSSAAFNIREGRDLNELYNDAPKAPVADCK